MPDIRNICLAAHVDAGKTSLAEQILFLSGAVRKRGSVDEGSSHFDGSPLEIRRGITIFSEYSSVNWRDCKINLLDTPGHVDFVAELERSFSAADGAVILLSATEGVEQHTELVWELAQDRQLPLIFFINKADSEGADIEGVFRQIKRNLTADAILWPEQGTLNQPWTEIPNLIDMLAERDNLILEKYLENETLSRPELAAALQRAIGKRQLFPVLYGSARTGQGVSLLLDCLVEFMPPPELKSWAGPAGKAIEIFKVRNEDKSGKLAYVKVLTGEVQVRDSIFNSLDEECKVAQIKTVVGHKAVQTERLETGDVGIITGLKDIVAGEILGEARHCGPDPLPRLLQIKIEPGNPTDWPQLLKAVTLLNEEDPLLDYEWDAQAQEMYVNIMGPIHREMLEELMEVRFGLKIILSPPFIRYFETVSQAGRGFCHFEPKKHYAEVEVEISPNPGAGHSFTSLVSTDLLPVRYQKAIEKALPEALGRGSLTGNPVREIEVKLLAGKHHLEHTHGGDFRIATIRAVRQALENNRIILLEPVIAFKIMVPKVYAGKVMNDISRMKGECSDPALEGDTIILKGRMPLVTSLEYPLELISLTGGRGRIFSKPAGLQPCHNQEEVLALLQDDQINADPGDKILYNSVSLFRAKRKMKKVTNEPPLE